MIINFGEPLGVVGERAKSTTPWGNSMTLKKKDKFLVKRSNRPVRVSGIAKRSVEKKWAL